MNAPNKYKQLYDDAPFMCVSVSPADLSITECNQTLLNRLGYNKEQISQFKIYDLYHPDCLEYAKATFEQFVNSGLIKNRRLSLKDAKGNKIPVILNAKAVRDDSGAILYSNSVWTEITDLVKAEQEIDILNQQLQQKVDDSEERFRLAAEGSNVGIWDWNIQSDTIYWSPVFKEMLGYPNDNELYTLSHVSSLAHPDDQPSIEKAIDDHLNKGLPHHYNLRFKHADGSYRWFEAKGQAIWDKEGKPKRMTGTVIDITDSIDTRSALQEANERFDLAVEGANAGIWDWDIRNNNMYWSPRFLTILGINDSTFKASFDDFKRRLHPDDVDNVVNAVNNHLKCKAPYEVEYRLKGDHGKYVWLNARGQALWDDNGIAYRMAGSVYDIDSKKQSELQLIESETKFKAIFNQTYQFIGMLDLDGNLIDANRSSLKAAGIKFEDVANKPFWETPWWTHSKQLQKELKDAVKRAGQGEFIKMNVTHPTGDGHIIYVDFSLKPAFDSQGNVAYLIPEGRDVTELKKIEEKLIQAKVRAEDANLAKSQFLANMSHEIRTPMNGVLGMIELLKDGNLSDEQLEYLDIIDKSGQALMRVINDILDLSKIEAGKLDISPTEFKINDFIHEIIHPLSIQTSEKNIATTYHLDSAIPDTIVADRERLKQVLINLTNNALKFTESGEIGISTKLVSNKDNKLTLEFCVSDTGIGISETEQQRLFKPFSQADNTTTRKYGGTGLGLTIVEQLVSLMGGQVWLNSQLGEGASFYFTIEAAIGSQVDKSSNTIKITDLKGMPVLIVDDVAVNQKIMSTMTTQWGMVATCAGGGQTALSKLEKALDEKSPYKIILLDILMPELDGFDVAERIRSIPELESTKIIMVTSHGEQINPDKISRLGIDGYLLKPLNGSQLFNAIQNALVLDYTQEEKSIIKVIPSKKKDIRVLLVEDNLTNQAVAKIGLQKAGINHITVAKNGLEALQKFNQNAYDIILMDVHMPIMDGIQATKAIRDRESKSNRIPIIAVTANALKGERELYLNEGMDDYLTKPFRPQQLLSIVNKFCNKNP